MFKISKLFEIADPYQLTIRGTKECIEVGLVGFDKGQVVKVSYEDADRMGNGIFEVVVTGIRNEMEEELDEREGYMKMKELKPGATIEDLEEFLLYHMDEADDRRSRINPALTKRDVWNINMGVVIEGQITKVVDLAIKNATREFGSLYEGI